MPILKTTEDYQKALAEVERLMDRKPRPGTPDAERLEELIVFVKNYEDERLQGFVPDPVEAIKFRMEQQNLAPRDLVPFVGSRSKVSEVLSRKRPLTLSMIRALHSGLGIPAASLLQGQTTLAFDEPEIDWARFPLDEMVARGWVGLRGSAEETLRSFFAEFGSPSEVAALYKLTRYRFARPVDKYALTAWTARIIHKAVQSPPVEDYREGFVSLDFMREIARLSAFDSGPLLAREFLGKHGISLVVEEHLPRTYLDGAATMIAGNRPVIGMSLRHDRIDNFWHTLMHELAHIKLHFSKGMVTFYDDLDVGDQGDSSEKEADDLAAEALIPKMAWRNSPARVLRTPEAARKLADKLGIHPAIVAGFMRRHWNSYRSLSQMVGHGLVRCLFTDVR